MKTNRASQELLELYHLSRQIVWRYQLDRIETQSLLRAEKTIKKAVSDLLATRPELRTAWKRERIQDVVTELDRLTLGIREQLTGEISNMAASAGAQSSAWHSETFSVGGKSSLVNTVALSPDRFRSFFQDTPLGGATLNQWVQKAFSHAVSSKIQDDLNAGVLLGEGYPKLVKRIMGHMDGFTKREVINVARSYVQAANVTAMQSVYKANADLVKSWKWSAILEPGNIATGTGTCIRCSVLDGQEFPIGGGPPIPLHVACRCVALPVLPTYRELGVDVDELEEVARPWTERGDVPIGEGGRNILDYGFHKGEYKTWFESRGEQFQRNVLGPGRYELWKSGKVDFRDFVDRKTGRQINIKELI